MHYPMYLEGTESVRMMLSITDNIYTLQSRMRPAILPKRGPHPLSQLALPDTPIPEPQSPLVIAATNDGKAIFAELAKKPYYNMLCSILEVERQEFMRHIIYYHHPNPAELSRLSYHTDKKRRREEREIMKQRQWLRIYKGVLRTAHGGVKPLVADGINSDAAKTVTVKDIEHARAYYEELDQRSSKPLRNSGTKKVGRSVQNHDNFLRDTEKRWDSANRLMPL